MVLSWSLAASEMEASTAAAAWCGLVIYKCVCSCINKDRKCTRYHTMTVPVKHIEKFNSKWFIWCQSQSCPRIIKQSRYSLQTHVHCFWRLNRCCRVAQCFHTYTFIWQYQSAITQNGAQNTLNWGIDDTYSDSPDVTKATAVKMLMLKCNNDYSVQNDESLCRHCKNEKSQKAG